jgi:hypothetical protein
MARGLSLVLTAVLVLALICGGCGGKSHGKLYEQAGGFSFDPPEGWKITEMPGMKYRVAMGAPTNDFSPNILVVDETAPVDLPEYLDKSAEMLKKLGMAETEPARETFRTDHGASGFRWVFEHEQYGNQLRQTQYYFANGDHKYVVTCTALADGGQALDAVFEESLKSFRIE